MAVTSPSRSPRCSTARPTRCSPRSPRRSCWRPAKRACSNGACLTSTVSPSSRLAFPFARPAALRMARSCSTGCALTGRRTCGSDGRRPKAISGGAPRSMLSILSRPTSRRLSVSLRIAAKACSSMAVVSGGTIASRLRSPFTLPSAPAWPCACRDCGATTASCLTGQTSFAWFGPATARSKSSPRRPSTGPMKNPTGSSSKPLAGQSKSLSTMSGFPRKTKARARSLTAARRSS